MVFATVFEIVSTTDTLPPEALFPWLATYTFCAAGA
jgi:hypothetical protein